MNYLCGFCGTPIKPFMTLGRMPLASGFLTEKDFPNEHFYQLQPALCHSCKLFQICEVPDPRIVFHPKYPHVTALSTYVVKHFQSLAEEVMDKYLTASDPFVVEIGSNDGTLLKPFFHAGMRHLGIEPADDIAEHAIKEGISTLVEFFNEDTALKVRAQHGPADVIIGANVIAHISDINEVARGVRGLLKDDGVFIIEAVYLGDLIAETSYSQIYDEHVYNFSVEAVCNVFKKFGLEVFDVAKINMQGGSLRCFLAPSGTFPPSDNVQRMLDAEAADRLNDPETLYLFHERCETSRNNLIKLVKDLKGKGNRIAGYGAATKSTIMLNYCQLSTNEIDYIVDSTPEKQEKFSPGMHIPVKSPDYFQKNYPDYAIIFPWNHSEEIRKKESGFAKAGGRWIIPLEEPIII